MSIPATYKKDASMLKDLKIMAKSLLKKCVPKNLDQCLELEADAKKVFGKGISSKILKFSKAVASKKAESIKEAREDLKAAIAKLIVKLDDQIVKVKEAKKIADAKEKAAKKAKAEKVKKAKVEKKPKSKKPRSKKAPAAPASSFFWGGDVENDSDYDF